MATTSVTTSARIPAAEILAEIRIRLRLVEERVERMLRSYRALLPGPERDRVQRELDIAAGIASELLDLEGLVSVAARKRLEVERRMC
jgi:hypothetical protein